MPKAKRPFLSGYKTYQPEEEGYGSPAEWKEEFSVRMDLDEANSVLGDDDPLVVLGLMEVPNAHLLRAFTALEIKKAYRKLAFRWHPDRGPNQDDPQAEAMFKKVQAAYVKLGGT